ncbi:MAG: hypothetical protein HYZ50_13535 [Deltaproteobacteria bacterium]|nr:hypothetical protein [Deltaproteobacteria bacterium]
MTRRNFHHPQLFITSLAFALALACALETTLALAQDNGRFCSATAQALFISCQNEVSDDFFKAKAICFNVSDDDAREECFADAEEERMKSHQRCGEDRTGRRNTCKALGEGRYDPAFDPADFDTDFTNLTHPNPYFPLGIGNRWEYQEGDESVTVEVTDKTKSIAGVTCIVVLDRVMEDGDLVEDTDDWFAQAKNGDVHYCGEDTKESESFDGDNPRLPELVSIDGSFKHGRDGDKSGIQFFGSPTVGQVYRQEFSVANAEDVAEVLSTSYQFGTNSELDQFVPQDLADLLCSAGDCVVTKEFSATSGPDNFERKYYAPGLGFFLEVKSNRGKAVQLVSCNFDARCASLPTP